MKKYLFIAASVTVLFACSNSKPEQAAVPDKVSMGNESSIKLEEGMLVSTNDTVCGMPIGNEPNDTVTYEGKLYGFCSTGCKESFLAEHTGK